MNGITPEQNDLLLLVSQALFDGQESFLPEAGRVAAITAEAEKQTVLPLIAPALRMADPSDPAPMSRAARLLANNARVFYEHAELHELMTGGQIPYVCLKGCASAAWYPDPTVRTMGDVDFLVREEDLPTAGQLVESIGMRLHSEEEGIHYAYVRPGSTWEMHRCVNGVPSGESGDRIRELLSDIIETAQCRTDENGSYKIPDTFHHGLVLLLHTAAHLTSEGVGLRHLCDWAVFAAGLDEDSFTDLFEEKLKATGLWHFAQILTLVCIRHLGAPARSWAGDADEALTDALLADILNGGNFGAKDADRTRQIKYISDRGQGTVSDRSPLLQAWDTLGTKARMEHKSRARVLLDYAALVASGQRKPDSSDTLKNAKKRKALYAQLRLFEN